MAGQTELISEQVDILQEQFPDSAGAELLTSLTCSISHLTTVDNLTNLELQSNTSVVHT